MIRNYFKDWTKADFIAGFITFGALLYFAFRIVMYTVLFM